MLEVALSIVTWAFAISSLNLIKGGGDALSAEGYQWGFWMFIICGTIVGALAAWMAIGLPRILHYVVSGIASYAGHAGKRMTMLKEVNLSFPRAYVCHTWYLVVRYLLKKQYVYIIKNKRRI